MGYSFSPFFSPFLLGEENPRKKERKGGLMMDDGDLHALSFSFINERKIGGRMETGSLSSINPSILCVVCCKERN
jgi:hypothetical protein